MDVGLSKALGMNFPIVSGMGSEETLRRGKGGGVEMPELQMAYSLAESKTGWPFLSERVSQAFQKGYQPRLGFVLAQGGFEPTLDDFVRCPHRPAVDFDGFARIGSGT